MLPRRCHPSASALGVGWRAELDGAVYGQPLVIGNRVIAATENDTVYAPVPAERGNVSCPAVTWCEW